MMPTVFIIEDDEHIRELVLYALRAAGFEAQGFDCTKGFPDALLSNKVDILLLDIMLPGEDGLSLLKKIRTQSLLKHLPVIMLTAKSSEYDTVKGLDFGADDYISKPFGVMELLARIKALLRRSSQNEKKQTMHILIYNDIMLDSEKHTVTVQGSAIFLTVKEFDLLRFLLEHKGIVLTRDSILEHVWGFDCIGETRTVDVHIQTLRSKLGAGGTVIETVRGVGYKIG